MKKVLLLLGFVLASIYIFAQVDTSWKNYYDKRNIRQLALMNVPTGSSGDTLLTIANGIVRKLPATSFFTAANPTVAIGLTAVNGSATTYMLSDAAPALSQSIAPTMTGIWNFYNTVGPQINIGDGITDGSVANAIRIRHTATGGGAAIFNTAGTDQYQIGHNNSAIYSGTSGANSGSSFFWYSLLKSRFDGGIDYNGAWYLGAENNARYGLKVDHALSGIQGLYLDSNGKANYLKLNVPLHSYDTSLYKVAVISTVDQSVHETYWPNLGGGGGGGVTSLNGNTGALTMDTGYIANFYLKARSLFSATSPITYNNSSGVIGIGQSTTSTNGYLSSTDWNTFNGKLSSVPFANPTALIGMTAINGSSSNAMRADAAPAIDPAISPTWTSTHSFSSAGKITFNPSSGTNRDISLFNFNSANNGQGLLAIQGSGSSAALVGLYPNGTGYSSNFLNAQLDLNNMSPDATNYEKLSLYSSQSAHYITSVAGGTGVRRPLYIGAVGSYFGNMGFMTTGYIQMTGTPVGSVSDYIISKGSDSLFHKLTIAALFANPSFTGTVTVPTPARYDNSTKAASTAYVDVYIAPVFYNVSAVGAFGTMSAGARNYITIDPASAIGATSVTTQASPNSGDKIIITAGGTIAIGASVCTAFTLTANSGQSIYGVTFPIALSGGDALELVWDATASKWRRLKF